MFYLSHISASLTQEYSLLTQNEITSYWRKKEVTSYVSVSKLAGNNKSKQKNTWPYQCAKKVVSDSPGLVDFAIGLVNCVFNLCFQLFRNSNNRRTVKSILLIEKLLGLVEMTSGLVNASFSLPKWQAVKMIFFAPCSLNFLENPESWKYFWHILVCLQSSSNKCFKVFVQDCY